MLFNLLAIYCDNMGVFSLGKDPWSAIHIRVAGWNGLINEEDYKEIRKIISNGRLKFA